MNLDFHKIAQASRCAVRRACIRLERRGFIGEATRARHSCDLWRDEAATLITSNAPRLRAAKARDVVRELSVIIYNKALRIELAAAERREQHPACDPSNLAPAMIAALSGLEVAK